jgi:hypothetical protein
MIYNLSHLGVFEASNVLPRMRRFENLKKGQGRTKPFIREKRTKSVLNFAWSTCPTLRWIFNSLGKVEKTIMIIFSQRDRKCLQGRTGGTGRGILR